MQDADMDPKPSIAGPSVQGASRLGGFRSRWFLCLSENKSGGGLSGWAGKGGCLFLECFQCLLIWLITRSQLSFGSIPCLVSRS